MVHSGFSIHAQWVASHDGTCCNSTTWTSKEGGPQIPGHPGLLMSPVFKKNTQKRVTEGAGHSHPLGIHPYMAVLRNNRIPPK